MATTADEAVIVEAVPNFSEGRRPEVVGQIARAIQAPGVSLLDQTSDWDHNRSVITVAGPPDAIIEGLFRAVGAAAQSINMFKHHGEHPRLGAADVVPLVPIQNISLEECAALSIQLGKRIGEELQLPVYLYEAAAACPQRRNLADVRRGEFERLVEEIGLAARRPDFGPARVGPAGAVIVGARPFLVAFNFFLSTSDVLVARQIARAIRESNGGFAAVKALGLEVNGQAQVSMNLVDYTKTPLHLVMDEVSRLALQHGTEVHHSELIGLIPQDVMLQAAAHYLKLPDFNRLRVVENAIQAALPASA